MSSIFFSYSHVDENLRDNLEKHLAMLKNQGFISTWHDRRILSGDVVDDKIETAMEQADIILLLVSSDFLASNYCYNIEMKRALERHHLKEARVIPIILRPCDWQDAPFGKLLASPTDGKPITSWANLDEAFLDVTKSIKAALPKKQESAPFSKASPAIVQESSDQIIRSSNLRVRKTFSDADKDKFLEDGFSYIEKHFENSLVEFEKRNPSYSTRFRKIDANKFTANIYRDGKDASQCKIMLGGMWGKSISYSQNAHASDNSMNDQLSVDHDDQNLFFQPLGYSSYGQKHEQLSFEGAAEYFWGILLRPLQ